MNAFINCPFEFKSLASREFEGLGSVFGNVDLGGDVVLPGAFSKSLAQHKQARTLPQMFFSHQMDKVPGKWLEMSENSSGLQVRGVLANTQLGDEMHTLLKLGALRGLSIGFTIPDHANDVSYNQDGVRMIKNVDLWEVSLVSLPMNPAAQVSAVKYGVDDVEAGELVKSLRALNERLAFSVLRR
jgi:HK97 family phage prohead protease